MSGPPRLSPPTGRGGGRRLLVLSLIGLLLFGPGLVQLMLVTRRQRRLDWQLRELAARQAALADRQRRLTTDPAYVEGLIRSTFKVAKPGELVVPLEAVQADAEKR